MSHTLTPHPRHLNQDVANDTPLESKTEHDPRAISQGHVLPSVRYCDQPYLVETADGNWVAVLTTGPGKEGEAGQHVAITRSSDQGRNWTELQALEDPDGPESSYAVLVQLPSGRICAFYTFNIDNHRVLKDEGGLERVTRLDTQGAYVWRYSDDGGETWSSRQRIPIREMAIDRNNSYNGSVRFLWNVGRPLVHEEDVLVPLNKVGAFGDGHYFIADSEGALLRSSIADLESGSNSWQTLPDGDVGIRGPAQAGRKHEEHSYIALADGRLACVFRTISGYPYVTTSADAGRSWLAPEPLQDSGGRLVKHPRAANFFWPWREGVFLYWFHNHGGTVYGDMPSGDARRRRDGRDPAWLAAVQVAPNGSIQISQPEIVLYHDIAPGTGFSYPDLLASKHGLFLSETDKLHARVHRVDQRVLDGLATQCGLATSPLPQAHWQWQPDATTPQHLPLVDLAADAQRPGCTLRLQFQRQGDQQQELITAVDCHGGITCTIDKEGHASLCCDDGSQVMYHRSSQLFTTPGTYELCYIIDHKPGIVMLVVNGLLDDGGPDRHAGWSRIPIAMRFIGDQPAIQRCSCTSMQIHTQAILVSEAVLLAKEAD